MENLFKDKCYEVGNTEQNQTSGEVTVIKKYPPLKKVLLLKTQLLGRGVCFKKVHVLNNYFF